MTERLHPDDIERIAEAVAEKLKSSIRIEDSDSALTASEVADKLGVSRAWVYRNADALGGKRLGEGPKARLRFPAEAVEAYGDPSAERREGSSSHGDEPPTSPRRRRNMRPHKSNVELLPVGRRAA